MKTIAKVSDETLKIENVLQSLKPGEEITYQRLKELSGVTMDNKGKAYMRTAMNRLKLEYSPMFGLGVKLCDSNVATQFIGTKVVRIDKAVRRAEKTTKRVTNQFYNQLNEHDQKQVNFIGSVFAAIRVYSTNAKQIFKKPDVKVINI